MKVLIDTYPLLVRSAGVKNYLYRWVAALRRAAPAGAIGTVPATGNGAELNHDGSVVGAFATYRNLAALATANHTGLPVLDWLAARRTFFTPAAWFGIRREGRC